MTKADATFIRTVVTRQVIPITIFGIRMNLKHNLGQYLNVSALVNKIIQGVGSFNVYSTVSIMQN